MLSPSEKTAFEQWASNHNIPSNTGTGNPFKFKFDVRPSDGEYADLGTRLAAWAYQQGALDWASGKIGGLSLATGALPSLPVAGGVTVPSQSIGTGVATQSTSVTATVADYTNQLGQITNDGSAANNIKAELTSKRVSKW